MNFTRATLLVLALALAACLIAWVLWPDASSTLAVDPGQNSNPPQEQVEVQSGIDEILADPTVGEARIESAPVASINELADVLPPYSGPDAISIVVTDGITGHPVPLADVYVANHKEIVSHTKDFAQRSGVSGGNQKLRRFGHHYQTNELGVAYIPPETKPPLILAEKAGNFAYVSRPKIIDRTISIQLEPNQRLTITVVDTLGAVAPAFPVALLNESPGSSKLLYTLYTDSAGQVVFEGLGSYFAQSRGDSTIHAALGIPMNPELQLWPQKLQITPQLLVQGEVSLALPPLGKVKLTLRDKQGAISNKTGFGRIYYPMYQENIYTGREVHLNAKVQDGVDWFEGVGLNTAVAATLYSPSSHSQKFVLFNGPTSPDSVLEIDLVID